MYGQLPNTGGIGLFYLLVGLALLAGGALLGKGRK